MVDSSFGHWRKNSASRGISTWKSPETRERKHTLGQMFGFLLWYEEPLLLWDCITLEFLAQVILRMAMGCQPSEHLRVDH